jgi:hypothetical protein
MKTDMSPAAVTMRIRQVSQLRKLCLSLAKAGREAREDEPPEKDKKEKNPRST